MHLASGSYPKEPMRKFMTTVESVRLICGDGVFGALAQIQNCVRLM
jgi:hypothetical protein